MISAAADPAPPTGTPGGCPEITERSATMKANTPTK